MQGFSNFAPRSVNKIRHNGLSMSTTSESGPPYSGPQVKPVLESINTPSDMKGMDIRTLKQVCLLLEYNVSQCRYICLHIFCRS